MLEVKDLKIRYGGAEAVHGVSLNVNEGEIVSLIGANGAGKSSILNAIAGFLTMESSGKIIFKGKDISSYPSWKRAALGITIVPEGGRIFPNLSVMENLELGGYTIKDKGVLKERLKKVFEIFPRLQERKKQLASTLSGGEKQMLSIGRALMMKPTLMLVDEISLGLMPKLVDEIFEILVNLRKDGITLLLSEQNTKKALQISDRVYIIQNGRIFKEGSSKEMMSDEEIKKAYLGI